MTDKKPDVRPPSRPPRGTAPTARSPLAKVPDFTATDDVSVNAVAYTLHIGDVLRGLAHQRTLAWPVDAKTLPADLPGEVFRARHPDSEEALLRSDGLSCRVNLQHGGVHVSAAGNEPDEVRVLLEQVRSMLPVAVTTAEQKVPIMFWSLSTHGPVGRARRIYVPRWDDIDGNYPLATERAVAPLLGPDFEPGVGGQLMLWHGPPGTGKTYALRALAWEWREWCDLHYITDPEVFFGAKASYMLDVLLHGDDVDGGVGEPADSEAGPADRRAEEGRWRLLVLEDTGELMSRDARARSGQGLSRLLNVVDGLIGQGLRFLVLVTTNEPQDKLHPAVARPGRCAENITFAPMPYEDARDWLVEHDIDRDDAEIALPGSGSQTIADLYAVLAGRSTTDDRAVQAGFVR